jgi:hypothetical protein
MEVLWLILVAMGPVLIAALLAYALITRRRPGPATRKARKRETERLYPGEPHGGTPGRGH